MEYSSDFTKQVDEDIAFHKKSGNQKIFKKVFELLNDTIENPFEGIGKPEPLKYDLSGCWSRRISREHRFVYDVVENTIIVLSLKGHYNN